MKLNVAKGANDELKKMNSKRYKALTSETEHNQSDWIVLGLAISFFVHIVSIFFLEYETGLKSLETSLNKPTENHVKINFVEKKLKQDIVELKQKETDPPKTNARLGVTNHTTDRETKIAKKYLSHKKGSKATTGQKKESNAKNRNSLREQVDSLYHQLNASTRNRQLDVENSQNKTKAPTQHNSYSKNARNYYEKLLASTYESLANETESGYQDYIEDDIEEGNSIDLNTKEYRYIGYFSNLRRSIELVWHYPRRAVIRGLEGTVGLKFSIGKDGNAYKLRVVKSSGYKELDQAIVNAVKLASPFSPIPDGFGKESMTITGSFSYVLSNWGAAH